MSAPCPRFGFIVQAAMGQDASTLGRALKERLAPTGLAVNETDGRAPAIVITREGSQATESDRQLVIALLGGDLDADGATVSDLVDLSY
jgi:hypothetical protein